MRSRVHSNNGYILQYSCNYTAVIIGENNIAWTASIQLKLTAAIGTQHKTKSTNNAKHDESDSPPATCDKFLNDTAAFQYWFLDSLAITANQCTIVVKTFLGLETKTNLEV